MITFFLSPSPRNEKKKKRKLVKNISPQVKILSSSVVGLQLNKCVGPKLRGPASPNSAYWSCVMYGIAFRSFVKPGALNSVADVQNLGAGFGAGISLGLQVRVGGVKAWYKAEYRNRGCTYIVYLSAKGS